MPVNDKTLIIITGFACNNNCVMCSLNCSQQGHTNRTTRDILLDIRRAKKENFERVEFSGGEPSIRKDIFLLLNYAKELSFKEVAMSTNGRIFFYPDMCKKFFKSGLNRVNISLHGHIPKLHNALTRTKNSFEEAIQGIANIKKYPSIYVEINSVISNLNCNYIPEMYTFISNLFINPAWGILDLIPEGNAASVYKSLSVSLLKLSKQISFLSSRITNACHINFFDFPLCLFPPTMRTSPDISLIVAKDRNQKTEQRGYHPTRITHDGYKYIDKYKNQVAICKKCVFKTRCAGIWNSYLSLYGCEEITTLAQQHECLNQ